MRVLLTGADGYLGVAAGDALLRAGHEVVGFDSGFHRAGWLYHSVHRRPEMRTGDVRDLRSADLEAFEAIVHMAELSNDPVGDLNADVTYAINHRGTLALAEAARDAGVDRFVHMSSCSVYGATGDVASRETDPTEPLTAYARCKVFVERDVGALADERFSPTFLRNATAFGASPRQRFDLVVNDLTAGGFVNRHIAMSSDGSPWRPFVHVNDIAGAISTVLAAERELVHNEVFNVGSDALNHRVRDIAQIVGSQIPGCDVSFGPPGADLRNYRVDFAKIHERFPSFRCEWDIERGVRELVEIYGRIVLDEQAYRFRGHTRLRQIRYLIDTEQIDDELRWVQS